jgi:hypothetical protein
MTPAQIAAHLHEAVDEGLRLFAAVDETRTTIRRQAGEWCAREVLGHLVDSAANNHRRFVLAQSARGLVYEEYDQDHWVAAQRYHQVPWRDLVALWSAYNRHLAHVIGCAPAVALSYRPGLAPGATPPAEQTTLEFLMTDYVDHLRHHVEQIRALLAQ